MDEEGKDVHTQFRDTITEIIGILILVAITVRIILTLSAQGIFSQEGLIRFFSQFGLESIFESLTFLFIIFSNILSLLFVIGIVYSIIRTNTVDEEIKKQLYPPLVESPEAKVKHERWQRVVEHINTENPSDWRLAILEADIILDELLDSLGYIGNTMADKLKSANKSDFRTLDTAWEAHKIRNAIAHEGQDFVLTQREARRIIGLYEIVFREFDFV